MRAAVRGELSLFLKNRCSLQVIDAAVAEYRAFLGCVCVCPPAPASFAFPSHSFTLAALVLSSPRLMRIASVEQPVPSLLADLAWHTHLLFPRRYAADCLRIAGRQVQHKED